MASHFIKVTPETRGNELNAKLNAFKILHDDEQPFVRFQGQGQMGSDLLFLHRHVVVTKITAKYIYIEDVIDGQPEEGRISLNTPVIRGELFIMTRR